MSLRLYSTRTNHNDVFQQHCNSSRLTFHDFEKSFRLFFYINQFFQLQLDVIQNRLVFFLVHFFQYCFQIFRMLVAVHNGTIVQRINSRHHQMITSISPSHQDHFYACHKGQFVLLSCRMHHREPRTVFYNILYHGIWN